MVGVGWSKDAGGSVWVQVVGKEEKGSVLEGCALECRTGQCGASGGFEGGGAGVSEQTASWVLDESYRVDDFGGCVLQDAVAVAESWGDEGIDAAEEREVRRWAFETSRNVLLLHFH